MKKVDLGDKCKTLWKNIALIRVLNSEDCSEAEEKLEIKVARKFTYSPSENTIFIQDLISGDMFDIREAQEIMESITETEERVKIEDMSARAIVDRFCYHTCNILELCSECPLSDSRCRKREITPKIDKDIPEGFIELTNIYTIFVPGDEVVMNYDGIVADSTIKELIITPDSATDKEYPISYLLEDGTVVPISTGMVLKDHLGSSEEFIKEGLERVKNYCEEYCFLEECNRCSLFMVKNRL